MKIKITKPDGSIVEAEGTPAECAELLGFAPPRVTYIPTVYPVPSYPHPQYEGPWWTQPVWGGPLGGTTIAVSDVAAGLREALS